MSDLMNRCEFVCLFEARDSNPNGDPDLMNEPRTDPETGLGIVSPECLKSKLRRFIDLTHGNVPPNEIYIRRGNVLNDLHDEIRAAAEEEDWLGAMCGRFYDVRSFGAVMTTGTDKKPIGVVCGPMQLGFARSIDRVEISTHALTRCCVTKSGDSKKPGTFAPKPVVNYGLYRVDGYFNPYLARRSGFGERDLELFFEALLGMWEVDRSAIRSGMDVRRLVVFEHSSPLGCAPSHKLLERVSCKLINDPPRKFGDYEVRVDLDDLPAGMVVRELL